MITPPELWPWFALVGLGLFHGVNPAMGWLFAVALGLNRHSRKIVLLSLVPIALGHAAAVAAVLAAVLALGLIIDHTSLMRLGALVLIGWALWHALYGHRRRVRVGLQTGLAGVALWSFLMASAPGAGLMLIPVVAAPVRRLYSAAGSCAGSAARSAASFSRSSRMSASRLTATSRSLFMTAPVPAGISRPTMTFSLSPSSVSALPLTAASVRTRVVSWNDAAEMNERVCRLALVMPSRTGWACAGFLPSATTAALTSSSSILSTCSPWIRSVSPGSSISTFCSICRTITSMCLSLMLTPWSR